MNDPNKTPPALVAGTIVGGVMTLGPIFGLLATAIGMKRAFGVLGNSGIADPHALANEISHTLLWTATGLAMEVIGLPLLITCVVLWIVHSQKVRRQQ